MGICSNCGSEIQGGTVCPNCGAEQLIVDSGTENAEVFNVNSKMFMDEKVSQHNKAYDLQMDMANTSWNDDGDSYSNNSQEEEYDNQEVKDNKLLAILSYLGILVLIPIFAAPDTKFVRFHASQGLNLFVCRLVYSFLSMIICGIFTVMSFVAGEVIFYILMVGQLFFFVCFILGIVNAAKGQYTELPFIGKLKILN